MNDTAQAASLELGNGERITQKQMLKELKALGPKWRLETPHELFEKRSRLTHTNALGAHSTDDTIKPGPYWTDEKVPGVPGARVVVGFGYGNVLCSLDDSRAFARAVRVSGQ